MNRRYDISNPFFVAPVSDEMIPYPDISDAVFDLNPDGIIVVGESSVVSTNAAFAALVGHEPGRIIESTLDTYVAPDQYPLFAKLVNTSITNGTPRTCRTLMIHRDGHSIPVDCSLMPVTAFGRTAVLIFVRDVGIVIDLESRLKNTTDKLVFFSKWVKKSSAEMIETNKKLANEIKLRDIAEKKKDDSDNRFRIMAEVIPEVFWMYSHLERKLIYVSSAFERIYGRPSNEYYENPQLWLEVIHPDDLSVVRESLDFFFGKERELEYRIMQPDWSIRWVRDRIFPVKNENGSIELIVGFCEDITERKLLEEELRILSITDGLTNLFNHNHFFTKIAEEIERARRIVYPLCLIMFDLNNFKRFNDKHGHLKGDEVLREVGQATKQAIRAGVDSAFRYGGDEFIIIAPNTGEDGARVLVGRIREKLSEKTPDIGISVGIACLQEQQDIKSFIGAADAAMYADKESQKNL